MKLKAVDKAVKVVRNLFPVEIQIFQFVLDFFRKMRISEYLK